MPNSSFTEAEESMMRIVSYSFSNNMGLFSRIKQVKGLISSTEKNIAKDKARYVFIKDTSDFIRNDERIAVNERGSDVKTNTQQSWKIDHDGHECKHENTVPDKGFINKFSNYEVIRDSKGIYKRVKKYGGQPRCYEHKKGKCCKEAKNLMCDNHNGWDCCGMVKNAKVSQFPRRISKKIIISGSICCHPNDKELIRKLKK